MYLEKAEEPEIKLPTSVVTLKKQENSRKTSTFGSLTMLKPFDCVDHNKLENSPSDGNSRPPYLPPAKPVCRSRSDRTGHLSGSILGNESDKAVYCHPAYLTCMQSTCEMPAWMNHKLESRLPT